MKTNLLSIIFVLMAMTVITDAKAESQIDFTYAGDNPELVKTYGTTRKERYDAAICVDEPNLAGYKLQTIRAYVNSNLKADKTTVWLSESLTLERGANKPSIFEQSVTRKASSFDGVKMDVLEYDLENPYELTGDPIYIGYTVNITDIGDEPSKTPLMVYEINNPEGFWIHTSATEMKWKNNSNTGNVLIIEAVLVGESNVQSLTLRSVDKAYAAVDSDFEVCANVVNSGGYNIENVDYEYTINGLTRTGHKDLDEPLVPNPALMVPLYLNMEEVDEIGNADASLTITKVNGVENMTSANTVNFDLTVMPFVPKRRPLVEEYTGLWCQWCPRGYVGMEEAYEHFGDDIVIAIFHNNDGMMVTNTYPMNISGWPKASIDRLSLIDPYYGTHSNRNLGIFDDIEDRMKELTIADINIPYVELLDNGVRFTLDAVFVEDIDNANYQVGYTITELNLSNPNWGQVNAYSGSSGYNGTPLEFFAKAPEVVYGLIYNNVVVFSGGMNGSTKLPTQIKSADVMSHTYEIPFTYSTVMQNPEMLIINGFIIDKNTGHIVNANKRLAYQDTGIKNTPNSEVVSTEYFNLSGLKVNNPSNGIFIEKVRLSDGSIRTSKKVIR